MINPNIFREYDIRGVVADDLTPEVVYELGRGIGTFIRRKGAKKFTVGRDGRLTSERIVNDLKSGLLTTGLELIDVGQVPTPVLYYSAVKLETDGGIQVTGSHNPPEFNGIKMAYGKTSIHGAMIQEIRGLCERKDYEKSDGKQSSSNILPDYIAWLTANLKLERKVRVGVDSGNGVGGMCGPQIFREIGAEVFDIYTEVDGRFPNHHPDPTVEKNLVALKKLVADNKLELGVGFDGDADRLGAIDGSGKVIWGDMLMTLFARSILKNLPGAKVIADVKCSENFFADVKKHGGTPIMWKTGHALIKSKLWDEKAALAGEMSGHFFFADRFFGFDDGIYSAGRLLEIVSRLPHSLAQELSDLPKTYSTPEIRVDCPDEVKFDVVDKVKHSFKARGLETIDLDGVRVNFGDGNWALVRASNTQPTLVLRIEAKSQDKLDSIQEDVSKVLKDAGFTFDPNASGGH
ncbi:MAG: phosphomannomutase/phosphoglucomutase [Calditrichaeota bacterium]|nr:phosphomannomutase/phosphoglucomutase [Calditrichota bacterium]MCB9369459.1 phosphomannomutase/phosphoglucomutase [Calditrichota bacterium]